MIILTSIPKILHGFISATLIGAGSIHGAIIVTQPEKPIEVFAFSMTASESAVPFFPLDLNGDGEREFTIRDETSRFLLDPTGAINASAGAIRSGDGFRSLVELEVGSLIEATRDDPQVWINDTRSVNECLIVGGEFGCSGFRDDTYHFGLRFELEGLLHVGWVRIRTLDLETGGFVEAWAYESVPGRSILAGVVPEPSTLCFLIGSLALVARRNRRFPKDKTS